MIITLAESELWLNSINTQFYLVLTTFLILIEPLEQYSRGKRTFLLVLLTLALFTGPVACFLAPAFLLKAYLSKSRIDFQVAIFVIFGAIIQGTICGYLMLYAPHGNRFENFDIQIFIISYLSDFLGLLKVVGINDKKNIGLVVLPYTLYLFYTMRKHKEGLLCVVSFILLTFLSLGSALNMTGSPRYGFVPSFILFTLIIHQLFIDTAVWEKYVASTVVILVFTLNIVYYQFEMNSSTEHCPNWKEEVAVWENDKKYQPMIFPCGGTNAWRVKLSKE